MYDDPVIPYFDDRCQELENLLSAPNNLNILKTSAILRLFLVDKECLAKHIEKQTSYIPYFSISEITGLGELPVDNASYHAQSLNPQLSPPKGKVIKVNRLDFLNTKIIYLDGKYCSVEEIVKLFANKLGGVHYDPPKKKGSIYFSLSEYRKKFHDLCIINNSLVLPVGRAMFVGHLKDIAQITLAAFDHLRKDYKKIY